MSSTPPPAAESNEPPAAPTAPPAPPAGPEVPQYGPYYARPQQAYPVYYGAPLAPYSTTAIVGFVMAFFVPIVGLILGIVSLTQIRKTGQRGHGLALASIVIGSAYTVFVFLIIVLEIIGLAIGVGSTGTSGY